ncbi:MAG: hypothetical protein MJ150_02290 [Clostridia bacterium]|nr:hypothetical protein [Clostridia bacterium]
MNKDNSKHSGAFVTGGTSLLVIFAVIALMLLDVLPMVSTIQEKKRAEQVSNSYKSYYAADRKAEEILSEIRSGNVPANVKVAGDEYSYEVKISDTQSLLVDIKAEETGYKVNKWQVVSTIDWEPVDDIELFNGGN